MMSGRDFKEGRMPSETNGNEGESNPCRLSNQC